MIFIFGITLCFWPLVAYNRSAMEIYRKLIRNFFEIVWIFVQIFPLRRYCWSKCFRVSANDLKT